MNGKLPARGEESDRSAPDNVVTGGSSGMPLIKRVGFFHFGDKEKADPVRSLEEEVAKHSTSALKDSVIVLPEAFNARGGLYQSDPDLHPHALTRLQALSAKRGIVFVAGLIEWIGGPNSAFLIDGNSVPVLLSRKRCGSWDSVYKAWSQDETSAAGIGGIAITALVCDDAGRAVHSEDERGDVLSRVRQLNAVCNVLCIPAFMTITDSLGTARLWANSITVVVANGCGSYPSVILHDGHEHISKQRSGENEIGLCDLWYSIERCAGDVDEADLEKCVSIIRSGGAVNVDIAKLRSATVLVLAKRGADVVGIGSVKRIRPDYAAGIADKSGFPLTPDSPELGYIAVDDRHRGNGLSHRLVGELLRERSGGLFATTDDKYMKRTLVSAGFVQRGREWEGNRGLLSLWIKS
jgi:predicted amidohydrolase